jgi:serine phosphatase RsbU (regulator of sigma subunit)
MEIPSDLRASTRRGGEWKHSAAHSSRNSKTNGALAQKLEIAKQVQARLFPQILPVCRTLDYAGICIQARQVGGDYYDFLDLGQERLGLIIGDISGKGIAAALLMANLQANLRSHSGQRVRDVVLRRIRSDEAAPAVR